MTIAEFDNSVDLHEVAHYEPTHLDLHCLPSSFWILNMKHFLKICTEAFCSLHFASWRVKTHFAFKVT